jgi:hypothetical protein
MHVIDLTLYGVEADFALARGMAELAATRSVGEAMLVAWFDGASGEGHPDARECTGKPGWLAYGESHGGTIRVNFNEERFVFIFAAG